jgi:hypothetical protein
MENESQRIQVDLRNIHYTKRNVPTGPYKQCANSPKKMSSILGYTLTGDYWLAQRYFRKIEARIHPDQNVLVTRTQVKTLYKQQTSHI